MDLIKWQPGGEDDDTDEHGSSRQPEPPIPTLVVLDPHEQRHTSGPADAHTKQQEVEEARHERSLLWVLVELISPISRQ